MNGVEASSGYALKGLVKSRPYFFVFISITLCIAIPGYCCRIFERPLVPVTGYDFDNIVNVFWFMVVTITTVGYGDLYIYSNMARFISILIMIYGVFIVSLFVVKLTN